MTMTYFVRIDDATLVRRKLLESSKDIIHTLKGFQRLMDIRDARRETAEQLGRTMSELTKQVKRLENLLPKSSLKELEQYLPKKAKRKAKPAKKAATKAGKEEAPAAQTQSEKQQPLTEMERLEKALSNIESRLGRL